MSIKISITAGYEYVMAMYQFTDEMAVHSNFSLKSIPDALAWARWVFAGEMEK